MTDEHSEEARKTFEYQSTTLMLLGVGDDLRGFVEQFLEMASKMKQLAEEKSEPHFAEWFGELIEKAEALRGAIPKR
jgi:hypothetical protein